MLLSNGDWVPDDYTPMTQTQFNNAYGNNTNYDSYMASQRAMNARAQADNERQWRLAQVQQPIAQQEQAPPRSVGEALERAFAEANAATAAAQAQQGGQNQSDMLEFQPADSFQMQSSPADQAAMEAHARATAEANRRAQEALRRHKAEYLARQQQQQQSMMAQQPPAQQPLLGLQNAPAQQRGFVASGPSDGFVSSPIQQPQVPQAHMQSAPELQVDSPSQTVLPPAQVQSQMSPEFFEQSLARAKALQAQAEARSQGPAAYSMQSQPPANERGFFQSLYDKHVKPFLRRTPGTGWMSDEEMMQYHPDLYLEQKRGLDAMGYGFDLASSMFGLGAARRAAKFGKVASDAILDAADARATLSLAGLK